MTVKMTMEEYNSMEHKISIFHRIIEQTKVHELTDGDYELEIKSSTNIKKIILDYLLDK